MQNLINGKTYQCGQSTLTVGKNLFQMPSAAPFLDNPSKLKQILNEQGYLYIPNFYDAEKVRLARNEVAETLASKGFLDPDKSPYSLIPHRDFHNSYLFKPNDFASIQKYINLVESPEIMNFMQSILDEEIFTYPYKWLRAVNKEAATGIHYDIVYMGRGTDQLLTCWTSLDDTPTEKGGLLMGSGFKNIKPLKDTYGKVDVDRDHLNTGWYTTHPHEINERFGGAWYTSNFNAGDIVVFGMYQLHGSLRNESNQLRLTCDTRYQRASEARDERWSNKVALMHSGNGQTKMDDLKKSWSV